MKKGPGTQTCAPQYLIELLFGFLSSWCVPLQNQQIQYSLEEVAVQVRELLQCRHVHLVEARQLQSRVQGQVHCQQVFVLWSEESPALDPIVDPN